MNKIFAILLIVLSCSVFATENTNIAYMLTTYSHTPCRYWDFDGTCMSRDYMTRETPEASSLRLILRDYENRIQTLERKIELLENR